MGEAKPFDISKRDAWEAFKVVKANQGFLFRWARRKFKKTARANKRRTQMVGAR